MARTKTIFAALGLGAATAAEAQLSLPRLPVIVPLGQAQTAPVMPMTPGALQADLVVKAGSDTVYFSPRGTALDANAIATLTAQAQWLLTNPMVNIRLEGHGDERDTRDYALAIGLQRAVAVRDFLALQGVPPYRITVASWGKERPGSMRVGPTTVSVGPRVVTKIQ